MSAPQFTILTQQPVVIDLSRPALREIVRALNLVDDADEWLTDEQDIRGEVDNFRNLLQNLLDRSEPETGNMDLIGG